MFDRDRLRIERFQVDLTYNIAFMYWSLKGVLAERWGHGPIFGAFTDAGNQVTLTPAVGPGEIARIQAMYGIATSSFNAERVEDIDDSLSTAAAWMTDVVEVLDPRRSVRAHVGMFGLHPVRDPVRSSEALVERFGNAAELDKLVPSAARFDEHHASATVLLVRGRAHLTIVVGVVGPPHRGAFFTTPDEDRDSKWWMGVRVDATMVDDGGIVDPVDELGRMMRQTKHDFDRTVRTALPSVVH